MDKNQAEIICLTLIYGRLSTTTYPQIILLSEIQMRILFHDVPKTIFINSGEKIGSGFTGPWPKNHGKMDTSTNIWQVPNN